MLVAQEVVRRDTISGNIVAMSMDAKVDEMLTKAEENCNRNTTIGNGNNNNSVSGNKIDKISVPDRPQTDAEICRKNPRILGAKIQLVVVKSNEEAQQVKAYFRNRFPTIKVETDASLRPNYKILAGSYISKQAAASDLAKIKQFFKAAIPIQYSVFCVEAKR